MVPFEVGQSVDARFEGRSRWFPGVIQHINEDGTLAINYDDGDQEERVLQKHVRPSKSKASKKTSVPNGSASKEAGVPNPKSTAILLCGMKGMAEGVKEFAAEAGIPEDKVLTNF